MSLSPEWKDPPLNSITQGYIRKMESLGYKPNCELNKKLIFTGLAIPLLINRLSLGGFLAVYKPRGDKDGFRWIKYTNPRLVGPETPLIAIPGPFRTKPNGYIVDNLKDYFKLINWIYCQSKTYALSPKDPLSMVIYVDQGDDAVVEMMRKSQLHFRRLVDFSGRYVADIQEAMDKKRAAFNVDVFRHFDENPLPYCNSRIQFEDAAYLLA